MDGYAVFGGPWDQWKVWLDWAPYYRAEGLRRTTVRNRGMHEPLLVC
ncbi:MULTISPECIES: hypothetical protein [unclassified Streptomyces]|nr:hypothetical protein [Streptomyces sp. NBC_01429]